MTNNGKKLTLLEQNLDEFLLNSPSDSILSSVHMDLDTNIESKGTLQEIIRKLHNELDKEHESNNTLRRKLNALEKDRFEQISKANDDALKLNGEIAKLRAEVERGEASRHSHELELTRLKREISQEKRNIAERETSRAELQESFKQRLQEQTIQMEKNNEKFLLAQREAQDEINCLKDKLEQKEKYIMQLCNTQENLESVKQTLELNTQQKESIVLDLQEQLQRIKEEKREMNEHIRTQSNNIELMKERQEQLIVDLGNAQFKVRSLEEAIEAERAAHLETKFGVEILQLRIREVESALQQEKLSKMDVEESRDKLNNKLTEIQTALEEALKLKSETYNELKRSEGDFSIAKKHLLSELEAKQTMIKKLSEHMNAHQKDFAELKQELAKAQKHQISLDELYNSSLRELDFLYRTFHGDSHVDEKRKGQLSSKKKELPKSQTQKSHSFLIEGIKQILVSNKRNQDQLTADIHRYQAQVETLTIELSGLKKTTAGANKDFESCHKDLTKANKELAKIKLDLQESLLTSNKLQQELQNTRNLLHTERERNASLAEKADSASNNYQKKNQMTTEFLLGLYQQLAASQHVSSTVNVASCASASDLFRLVRDNVALLITTNQELDMRVSHLDSELRGKQELIQELQSVQEEEIGRLYGLSEGHTEHWKQQKDEMEKHYQQLIVDYQQAQKKLQSLADQAWEKLRVSSSLQQGLESECIQQRQQLSSVQRDMQGLLAAFALIIGGFYPIFERFIALGKQRSLLISRMERFVQFRDQIGEIVENLVINVPVEENKLKKRRKPLLLFRKGVICVLALNRLRLTRSQNCQLFVLEEPLPGISFAPIYCGDMSAPPSDKCGLENAAIEWLTSTNLMSKTNAVVGDLCAALDQAKSGSSGENRVLCAAKKCLHKIFYQLPATFPLVINEALEQNKNKLTLCHLLRRGLLNVLHNYSSKNIGLSEKDTSSLIMRLQEQLLALTDRLHTAEKERRDLRIEVNKLRQEKTSWTAAAHTVAQLKQEMETLRCQIERQRGDNDSKLDREINRRTAELKEENAQIRAECNKKEESLIETHKELAEMKNNVKRHEQHIRQLNKQLVQIEQERKQLKQNVSDAENALNTAARDKDLLITFMKTIENLMTALVNGPMPGNIGQIQPGDHLPTSKPSTELKACQHLVETFIVTQRPLIMKVNCLQEEVNLEKNHVKKLKQELKDMCHRDYGSDDSYNNCDNSLLKNSILAVEHVDGGDFIPLIPESDGSFCSPKKQIKSVSQTD